MVGNVIILHPCQRDTGKYAALGPNIMLPEGRRPKGNIMQPEGSIMWPVGGIFSRAEGRGAIFTILYGRAYIASGPRCKP